MTSRRDLHFGNSAYLNDFATLEEAREVIGAFIERYDSGWLLQRHGYLTPAPAREKLGRKRGVQLIVQ